MISGKTKNNNEKTTIKKTYFLVISAALVELSVRYEELALAPAKCARGS